MPYLRTVLQNRPNCTLYAFNNVPMSALAFFKVYKMYKRSDSLVVIKLTVISFVKIKFALMQNVIF